MKITKQQKIIIENNKIQIVTTKNKIKKKRNNKITVELSDSFNEVLQKLRNNTVQRKKSTKKNLNQH